MSISKTTLCRRAGGWLASVVVLVAQLGLAQNFLRNGDFEADPMPAGGWKAVGSGCSWPAAADGAGHCLEVRGTGQGSSWWQASGLPLKPGGLYRLSFRGRKAPGTTGGCAIAGLSRVNRDFQFTEEWERYSFVFSVPDDGTNDFLRLGQWEVKGELFFDDAELLPVVAAHYRGSMTGKTGEPNFELDDGECITDGVYTFQPDFGGVTANYHRCLTRNTASFNSDRWVFQPGAEVVYRFSVLDVEQTKASVQVALNHFSGGALSVDASRDGTNWLAVGLLDGTRRATTNALPASLFPTPAIYVRLKFVGPAGALQVNHLRYEARLAALPSYNHVGWTRLMDVLQSSPDIAVALNRISFCSQATIYADFTVTNQTSRAMRFQSQWSGAGATPSTYQTNRAWPSQPGQASPFYLTARVEQPGTYAMTTEIQNEQGNTLFVGRVDVQRPMLFDPRMGYRLQADDTGYLWWCESGWKVGKRQYADRFTTNIAPQRVEVSLARGEYEPAQVVFYADQEITLLAAKISGLTNSRGDSASIEVRLNHVLYTQVTHPTDNSSRPDNYPDPLPPLSLPLSLVRDGNYPLWLTFHAPRDAKAGDYSGELELKLEGCALRVPLAIHVYDFVLPEETHLQSAFGLGTHFINQYHKLTRREDQVAVYEKYLRSFAEHRISPYSFYDYAPIKVSFPGQGTNQHAQVDFTEFDRAAARWLDGAKFSTFQLQLKGMGGGTYQSRSLGKLEGFTEGTPEHTRLFQDYLGQVERHLRDRGWLPKAFTYWFDEPDPKDYEFVVAGMKRLKAAAPGLRRMLTEQPEPALMGNVDVWCGLTPEWTSERVRARRAAGEEVWWYICCAPKAPYVTEFIDHPGTELRLWPWQSWQYDVTGILVWETVYWNSPLVFVPPKLQDPWKDPMSYTSGYDLPVGHVGYWGNGDGRFLYPPRRDPNTATNACLDAPITSIRWENLRDGMEDYEYFWLLDQEVKRLAARQGETDLVKSARALLTVPPEISKDLTHFTTDPRVMLAHRDRMARMIERLRRE